jgi:rhodanese-related sulfurtransferase
MKTKSILSQSLLLFSIFIMGTSVSAKVSITKNIESIEVTHLGEKVIIERSSTKNNNIGGHYDKTSHQCPPFCIQPSRIAKNIETVAELEVLKYLKDKDSIVIDSRTPDWLVRGTIPGTVNIPWTTINKVQQQAWSEEMEEQGIDSVLQQSFLVKNNKDILDFTDAKTLVVFCNGAWCGQSVNFIKTLINKGYPSEKLKWYRGGMQAWESFGLTIIKSK